jgi:hypothetical protein
MNFEKEIVAGFIDGDGLVCLPASSGSNRHPTPCVCIYQSHDAGIPEELHYIQRHYSGDTSAPIKVSTGV